MKPITRIHLSLDDMEDNLERLRENIQIIEGNQKTAAKSITLASQNPDNEIELFRVKGECSKCIRILFSLSKSNLLNIDQFLALEKLGEILGFNVIIEEEHTR